MTKYLETAKFKKPSETIRLHPYIGNKSSINMISQRPLRPRGSYSTSARASTPQPRQRIPCISVEEDYIIKAEDGEDRTEMVRLQYSGEEAARYDDVNHENYQNNNEHDIKNDFTKLLQYFRQLPRLLLSVGRLCDDWRRRPIPGTLHFVQRHEQELKGMSTKTKTLLFMTCMFLLIMLLAASTKVSTMEIDNTMP
eukprot:3800500-Amphidinium_carterae.2